METREYARIGERVCTETLPNGLKIFVVPKPDFHKSYAFFAANYGGSDMRFKLGGRWIDTPAGVAHFLEHKMFEMESGDALMALSANGASPNAFTSNAMTAYHFECTEKFFENLRILLDFVSTPYFTDKSVAKEQGIIGQEIRMVEDDPDHSVYLNLMKCLYKNNPARTSIAGTVESIAEISPQTLYDCHKVFYNPSNMVLCAATNQPPEKIAEMAAEMLPKSPGELPERDYGEAEGQLPVELRHEARMEVASPLFMLGAKVAPASGRERLRQSLIAEVALKTLLGRSSKLYARMYAEGLINSNFDYGLEYLPGTAVCVVTGESREPGKVFEETALAAEALCASGPDAGLLLRTKRALTGAHLRSLNSLSGICYERAEGYFAGFDPYEAVEILDSVGADDIISFVGDAFDVKKLAISVVSPVGGDRN